jgi:hypothetical protein
MIHAEQSSSKRLSVFEALSTRFPSAKIAAPAKFRTGLLEKCSHLKIDFNDAETSEAFNSAARADAAAGSGDGERDS